MSRLAMMIDADKDVLVAPPVVRVVRAEAHCPVGVGLGTAHDKSVETVVHEAG